MKKFANIIMAMILLSCSNEKEFDAQGTFEATEIIISAEATGKILSFDIEEGASIKKGGIIGVIDSTQLFLQRKQLISQQSALINSIPDVKKQVASIEDQIAKQKSELNRIGNLLKDNAATQKQYDDIKSQINILESQLAATLSTLGKNSSTIENNSAAIEAQIEALNDLIEKCRITSPIDGTVLVKYAEEGEYILTGKPLIKIADLNKMYLRAYFTSEQLSDIKLGDKVKVIADFGNDKQYEYTGHITWISSESEFTPKTIQTKESRANLVYAVKIAVKNDGRLKLGLSGNVIL